MALKRIEYLIRGIGLLLIPVGLILLPRLISSGRRIDNGPLDYLIVLVLLALSLASVIFGIVNIVKFIRNKQ